MIGIQSYWSDPKIDARLNSSQRQLSLAISAIEGDRSLELALNICLVLDCSSSMAQKPLTMVKQAAIYLVKRLKPSDRLSVIAFNHRAKVVVPNQVATNIDIKKKIESLTADGGTSIDEGLRLGLKEVAAYNQGCVSRIFLLTDGENEHGDDRRCLRLAELSAEHNVTIDTLGFGEHWNQDVLEQISDLAQGTLA